MRVSLGRIPAWNAGSNLSISTSARTPFLPVGSIHQHGLLVEDWRACPLQPGLTVLAQCHCLASQWRTTTPTWCDASNIQGIPFGFLDQFVLFSCWVKCFHFSITSLWQECRLHEVLQSSSVEALCPAPIRLPRCVVGATWGLYLWMGETVAKFSNGILEPETRCLVTRATTGGSNCTNCTVGLLVASLAGIGPAWADVKQSLHLKKEAMCWVIVFLNATGRTIFCPLSRNRHIATDSWKSKTKMQMVFLLKLCVGLIALI